MNSNSVSARREAENKRRDFMTRNMILNNVRSSRTKIFSMVGVVLLASVAAFGQSAQSNKTPPKPAPKVVPPNVLQKAAIKIFNKCPTKATFEISDDSKPSAPWITWPAGQDIQVGPNSSGKFSFGVSTFGGIKPGTYQTSLSAKCTNCGDCVVVTQTTFPVAITVPADELPPSNPGGGAGGEGGSTPGGGKPPAGSESAGSRGSRDAGSELGSRQL
jgi:hypothetical protein